MAPQRLLTVLRVPFVSAPAPRTPLLPYPEVAGPKTPPRATAASKDASASRSPTVTIEEATRLIILWRDFYQAHVDPTKHDLQTIMNLSLESAKTGQPPPSYDPVPPHPTAATYSVPQPPSRGPIPSSPPRVVPPRASPSVPLHRTPQPYASATSPSARAAPTGLPRRTPQPYAQAAPPRAAPPPGPDAPQPKYRAPPPPRSKAGSSRHQDSFPDDDLPNPYLAGIPFRCIRCGLDGHHSMDLICTQMPPLIRTKSDIWRQCNHLKRIDLNTADESTIRLVRDPIGPKRAASIVAYRTAHGPFRDLDSLAEVGGISRLSCDEIRHRVCLSGFAILGDGSTVLSHYVAVTSSSAEVKPSVEPPRAVSNPVNIVDMVDGSIMLDTGCRRSVAGPKWHRAMRHVLKKHGLTPVRKKCAEDFVFGDGATYRADIRWVYPIAISGRKATLDVAEVSCQCPGLMSRKAMAQLGMSLNLADDTVDIAALDLVKVPLLNTSSGHPTILVTDFGSLSTKRIQKFPQCFTGIVSKSKKATPTGSSDEEFVKSARWDIVPPDDFTRRLWQAPPIATSSDEDEPFRDEIPDDGERGLIEGNDYAGPATAVLPSIDRDDPDDQPQDDQFPLTPKKRPIKKGARKRLVRHLTALTDLLEDSGSAPKVSEVHVFATDVPPKIRNRKPRFMEIFSWSFVLSTLAASRGWDVHDPITIENGYDLTNRDDIARAKADIIRYDPDVVTTAWPCTYFSPFTYINEARSESFRESLPQKQALHRKLVKFAAWVYDYQVSRGKHWFGENPQASRAWKLPELQKVASSPDVHQVDFPQCALGLKDPTSGEPMRKMTRVLTTSPAVASNLAVHCTHDHHQLVEGSTYAKGDDGVWKSVKRSVYAGGYPQPMARAILKGFETDLMNQTFMLRYAPEETEFQKRARIHDAAEGGAQMLHRYLPTQASALRVWEQTATGETTFQRPFGTGAPHWKSVSRRQTFNRDSGQMIEDVAINGGYLHDHPLPPGVQNLTTKFWYEPAHRKNLPSDVRRVIRSEKKKKEKATPSSAAPARGDSRWKEAVEHAVRIRAARRARKNTVSGPRGTPAVGVGVPTYAQQDFSARAPTSDAGATAGETVAPNIPTFVPQTPPEDTIPHDELPFDVRQRQSGPIRAEASRRSAPYASGRSERPPALRDHWLQTATAWIRVHVAPRRHMFSPAESTRGGPDVATLLRDRRTTIRLPIGETIVEDDYWTVPGSTRALADEWTGQTMFLKRGPDVVSFDGPPRAPDAELIPPPPPTPAGMDDYLMAEDLAEGSQPPAGNPLDASAEPSGCRTSAAIRKEVARLHIAFGHPAPVALARMLLIAKADPMLVQFAKKYTCSTCARRAPPARIPKVTLPYRPTRFNEKVGLDVKYLSDAMNSTFYALNVLDLATGFQILTILPTKTPLDVVRAFEDKWVRWAGVPDVLVFDRGGEFLGPAFREMVERFGSGTRVTPVEAAWQQGMVERHGGVISDMLDAFVRDLAVAGSDEMEMALCHCSAAKNRRPGRTGFSPRAAVFGVDERLPGSILSHRLEHPDEVAVSLAATDPQLARSNQIRAAAMRSVIELDHAEKWRMGLKTRRSAMPQEYTSGDAVYYWVSQGAPRARKPRRHRTVDRWHGPAVIIGHEWDHRRETRAYWVSHAGILKLIPAEHLRPVTDEEAFTTEQLRDEVAMASEAVRHSRSHLDYEDRTGEAPPPGPDDVPVAPGPPGASVPVERGPARRYSRPGTPRGRPPAARRASRASLAEPDQERTPDPPATPAEPLIVDPLDATAAEPDSVPDVPDVELADPEPPMEVDASVPDDGPLEEPEPFAENLVYVLKERILGGRKKGRELDPRHFSADEWAAFEGPTGSDAKEWAAWLQSGAVRVLSPDEARHVPADRIFRRPARFVRTNKNKDPADLLPKSRIVFPGDVDVDAGKLPEDGGFRTDSPTSPQVAFHVLCSEAVIRGWRLATFDVKTAFLSGDTQEREIYVRPPRDGLPGVPDGALLQPLKGVFGLKEAPRLWYLATRKKALSAGFEELKTAKSTFVVRDPSSGDPVGMLVLHVDDGCWAGSGPIFRRAQDDLRAVMNMGKEETDEFTFLGRHVRQLPDGTIEIDQYDYCRQIEAIKVPRNRRQTPDAPINDAERRDLRALLGKLIWLGRQTMPQLCYGVSDLQQKVCRAVVTDLARANTILREARTYMADGVKLVFQRLPDVDSRQLGIGQISSKKHPKKPKVPKSGKSPTGIGQVNDASFMGQGEAGSQMGFLLLRAPVALFDGETTCHLMDWGSGKIHRKVRSTLAAEAASASHGADRATYLRALIGEFLYGYTSGWRDLVSRVPGAIATDCRSLYDLCRKHGSLPQERRIALDLLDVREGLEDHGDQIRWIPTAHMLADALTKRMPPDLLLKFLKDYRYAFKYSAELENVKKEARQRRALAKKRASPQS